MQWTGLNELREKYLSFFESKGHLRLPSFPLVPKGDASLLLINSGMAPMKKYFTGEVTPPRKRVTTCQKCIRTPDIERVGKTARHGTYFEMLGNFSFGDYFKHEATAWAWEFCTKVLEMPAERIYVSIYENDDEAFEIWTKEVGVSPDRIVRLGKEDNFWEHGSGPCGPCSELYFDRGEEHGCGSPDCAVGCDCDRFVEFWNNVFTQFDNDGNGNYTPLDHPNIDTGMGLERLACIMQGVANLFEVDTVQNIMKHISRIANVNYGESERTDVSLRVITDHIRSTTFMIGDSVLPSNEGRGYVLRRLLRRAARHGRLIGIHRPFLYEVCETVIHENLSAYPELNDKKDFIVKVIRNEEEAFEKTIDSGLALLEDCLSSVKDNILSGEVAFKLYDTYGFPIDLTKDILEERGVAVDEEAFNALMAEQRARARAARKDAGADAWKGNAGIAEQLTAGEFVGYAQLSTPATVTAMVCGDETVTVLNEGDKAVLVLDTTPFYGESGGQVGDKGVIETDTARFEVTDTQKTANGAILHIGVLTSGELSVGALVTASVNAENRAAVVRNHSAAHLLQAALRTVLGNHVEQAGQLVNAERVRFDFTHFSALNGEELAQVETLVNQWILEGNEIEISEMSIDEARKQGAMALFGEKYGDVVRVVKMGDVSMELCGGTHADNTSKVGLFRILSETSVAAGVRRIEAVTGNGVLALLNGYRDELLKAAETIKANGPDDVARRAAQLQTELKDCQRELQTVRAGQAANQVKELFNTAVDCNGIQLVSAVLENVGGDELKTLCDSSKDFAPEKAVVVLAGVSEEKGTVTFVCYCTKGAVAAGANAGNIVRQVATVCGGKGGGKPDMAMAGGKDISKVTEALATLPSIIGQ